MDGQCESHISPPHIGGGVCMQKLSKSHLKQYFGAKPRQGASDEHHNMFFRETRKISVLFGWKKCLIWNYKCSIQNCQNKTWITQNHASFCNQQLCWVTLNSVWPSQFFTISVIGQVQLSFPGLGRFSTVFLTKETTFCYFLFALLQTYQLYG